MKYGCRTCIEQGNYRQYDYEKGEVKIIGNLSFCLKHYLACATQAEENKSEGAIP